MRTCPNRIAVSSNGLTISEQSRHIRVNATLWEDCKNAKSIAGFHLNLLILDSTVTRYTISMSAGQGNCCLPRWYILNWLLCMSGLAAWLSNHQGSQSACPMERDVLWWTPAVSGELAAEFCEWTEIFLNGCQYFRWPWELTVTITYRGDRASVTFVFASGQEAERVFSSGFFLRDNWKISEFSARHHVSFKECFLVMTYHNSVYIRLIWRNLEVGQLNFTEEWSKS